MFLSKIWFFLICVVAILAVTVALLMPRPAQRAAEVAENKTVRRACLVTDILLREDARSGVQLTGEFASAIRTLNLSSTAFEASKADIVSGEANASVRNELAKLVNDVDGDKPSFVWLLDRRGRVVARSDLKDKRYGDSVRGYPLVKDALDGYVRDDLWLMDGALYRVAAAPILTGGLDWAGAVVLGKIVDQDWATRIGNNINANINFYVGNNPVASMTTIQIHNDVAKAADELPSLEVGQDCNASSVMHLKAGENQFVAVSARLPGAAGEQGAFYTVYIPQAPELTFMGTLRARKKEDLGFGNFPWIAVGGLFIVFVVVGFVFMRIEVDRPLGRLNKETVALAQGERERMDETAHKSKYGSVARSINIAIDKMHREAKAARKDLDQLLGPAPEAGAASTLPPVAASEPTPPPPAEFRFGDTGGREPTPPPPPDGSHLPAIPKTPPPKPAAPPSNTPPAIPVPSARKVIEDDPLLMKRPTDSQVVPDPVSLPGADDDEAQDEHSESTRLFEGIRQGSTGFEVEPDTSDALESLDTVAVDPGADPQESYFRQIFEEFLALKTQCGESTENLTYERFSRKLQKNQDALMQKHGCKSVRFQVYEKDGKAALKASPVR